jgi:hypothetical protein
MNTKILSAVLLFAVLPLTAIAEEPTPAAAVPATEAPAPDLTAAPAAAPEAPAATDNAPAQSPLGDSPTPPPGKRVCNMKGKGMMAGYDMGPGKGCGCPGHQGCSGGHCGGHGGMHADMAQRLDLIEARLAKIEAMLESLMRR